MEQIAVTISKDGQVTLHVQGVKGMGCADLTADLIAALGGQITQQTWTMEAYEQPTEAATWNPSRSLPACGEGQGWGQQKEHEDA